MAVQSSENELRKQLRMTKIRSILLTSLKIGGILTLTALAPNTLRLLGRSPSRFDRGNLRSALLRLERIGLVEFSTDGNSVSITHSGRRYLERSEREMTIPKVWDRHWRVVIFDIPERRRRHRDALRSSLERVGFLRLQNSVWVYPYDCEELITLLKTEYRLGKEVLYMIVEKLERDVSVRRHFKLA